MEHQTNGLHVLSQLLIQSLVPLTKSNPLMKDMVSYHCKILVHLWCKQSWQPPPPNKTDPSSIPSASASSLNDATDPRTTSPHKLQSLPSRMDQVHSDHCWTSLSKSYDERNCLLKSHHYQPIKNSWNKKLDWKQSHIVARTITVKLVLKLAAWLTTCYNTVNVMMIQLETTEFPPLSPIANVTSHPVR